MLAETSSAGMPDDMNILLTAKPIRNLSPSIISRLVIIVIASQSLEKEKPSYIFPAAKVRIMAPIGGTMSLKKKSGPL